MIRPSAPGIRVARLAVAAAAALAVLAAASARAGSVLTVSCAQLPSALAGGHSGDVIVLDGLCTGSFTLPAVAITLTGAPGTTSGFDGAGATAPLLSGTVNDNARLTLSSLVFQNAELTSGAGGGGLDLSLDGAGGVTLSGDTFTGDTVAGAGPRGGGLRLVDGYVPGGPGAPPPASVDIVDSTFADDGVSAASGGEARGGGAWILLDSAAAAADLRALVLTGDSFTADSVLVTAGAAAAHNVGGGLAAQSAAPAPLPLTQARDSFVGDSVLDSAPSPASNYGGGGEWAQGFDLVSTGDVFAGDEISGTGGASESSWGGGLGILDGGCAPASNAPVQSSAVELVAAGNAISGGSAAESDGAAIRVGCSASGVTNLSLADSTVSANHATAGGIAGISGGPGDSLTLADTIDAANAGGADLGGFGVGGGGGTLAASYSDACVAGGPAAGAGDICAAPDLAGGTDVHETAASPTIDAGSGALVPAGLATDVFGNPRIDRGGAGLVDIGAAEYVHPPPAATTGAVSAVTVAGAQLSGSVDPQGTPTTWAFQYGTTTAYGASTPAVAAGSGTAGVAAAATLAGLAPDTTYDYRIVATSAVGTAVGANMVFTTAIAAPAISGLAQSHRRWRVGPTARAARHRRIAVGTTFSYTLNVPATVTFTFTHRVTGRLVAGVCLAKTRRDARDGRCARIVTAGILVTRAGAGADSRSFSGILGGHRFGPGAYMLHLHATTAGGASSPDSAIGFTIVKA